MEYTKLGQTDIKISKVCVGCMSFGKAGTMHDWTLDEAATEEVVKHALDLGINFFDTANGYSAGTSEEYLGRALKKNISREKAVIASKVYFNPGRLSREAIHREIDGTLKRLGTDYLDLYIIHRFDYETPIEETMEALNDLVKAGKVRALGASAMYGYQFYNMQLCARNHGWARFEAMENHYNLLYREDERELIPICRQMGVSLMPYSPLAAGHLTRPTWTTDTLRSKTDRVAMGKYDRTEEQDMQIVTRVHELAEKYGVQMQEIAWHGIGPTVWPRLSWARRKPSIWMMPPLRLQLNSRTRISPIWRSRMCPTALWVPLTAIRRRVSCCWTKRPPRQIGSCAYRRKNE